MNLIAIDPGERGAIVVKDDTGIHSFDMPQTPKDIFTLLYNHSHNAKCMLEKVNGMPGQGGVAMFTFGKGYGWLEMALIALEIPCETVSPQKWQKSYSLGTKSQCASSSEWKNKLKAKAQQLFPSEKVTLKNSDALLILNYFKSCQI